KSQFGSLRIRDSDFFFMLRSRGCSPYCNSITSTLNFRSNTRQTMFIRETSFFALALLLTISVTVSAQQLTAQTKRQKRATQQNAADWWKHAVYYEIYPRSF